jgi:N-acylneuraminate cytidylyltransferase
LKPEILAIIPARGGSKGLPNKNILPLAGHPLIAYSIKAALDSPSITRTIVSTDAEAIASVARQYGAEVPFLRPAEYAQDHSLDYDVFVHALAWLNQHEGYRPDFVVQLRPTSPLRSVELVEGCIHKLAQSEADSIRVVTPALHTPFKMWRIVTEDAPMVPLMTLNGLDDPYNQPRQHLPTIYWQIGTLDVIRTSVITEQHKISGRNILPYVVGQEWAMDIDDLFSFQRAEAMLHVLPCIKFDA